MKKFLIIFMVLLCMMLYSCEMLNPAAGGEPSGGEVPEEPKEPEAEVFTVTFNMDGGSEVEAQEVERGCKVKKPADPQRYCECEFLGWYIGDEKWSFAGYVVTEDITLTAKWAECFGMNAKEKEILESFLEKDGAEWADVVNIERREIIDGDFRYIMELKNGKTKTVDIGKELVT